ncbi:hypothetical protein CF15_06815 [Pyrodictium occultum]|uniref:Transcription factor NikR nickel binding C-terminal domain-containing protein n=1 Tax=Pyrodictium occultum TaxID=2309 RepID=A0A0V8RWK7_PYROC|nr:hypothetical protein [Pyrodictium occultum]KSW12432.1 hypothetical protein CF15_06815 [Pyrodictium occultum]
MIEQFEASNSLEGKRAWIIATVVCHEETSAERRVIGVIHRYLHLVRSFHHQLLDEKHCINIAVAAASATELRPLMEELRRIRGVERVMLLPV